MDCKSKLNQYTTGVNPKLCTSANSPKSAGNHDYFSMTLKNDYWCKTYSKTNESCKKCRFYANAKLDRTKPVFRTYCNLKWWAIALLALAVLLLILLLIWLCICLCRKGTERHALLEKERPFQELEMTNHNYNPFSSHRK